jgi:tetratricopeptide (TPR) repeat protein
MSPRTALTALSFVALLAVGSDAFAKNPPRRDSQPTPAVIPSESVEDLLNQGFASYEAGAIDDAANALSQVLDMPGASSVQLVEARLGLALVSEASGQSEVAIDHLDNILRVRDVLVEYEVAAHVMRGRLLMTLGSTSAADDFTAVIENPAAAIDSIEDALVWRAVLRGALGDWHGVIDDTNRLLESSIRPAVTASALAMRGMAHKALGNEGDAALDLMEAYRMLDLPADMVQPVANALIDMGIDPNEPQHRS